MSVLYQPAGKALEYSERAVNLYRGCAHGCAYCYAPNVLRMGRDEFRAVVPRPGVLAQLKKDCLKDRGRDVLLCFTCDPYPPDEVEQGTTRKAIEILQMAGHRVTVLTKAGTRAVRDFDLLHLGGRFASTLTFLDDERSRLWEPGAALPGDRLEALQEAHRRDIPTWVSLEPVLDPESALAIIELTHSYVDLYKVGRWNYDPRSNTIDWKLFGHQIETLLKSLGKRYLIKADLRKAMAA